MPERGTRVIHGLQHGKEWEQNCPCDREGKKVLQLQSQTREPQCTLCTAKKILLAKEVIPLPCVLANASKSQRLMSA